MLKYRELESGKDRFFKDKDGNLFQRAAVSKDNNGKAVVWRVKQVMDTVTQGSPDYNEKAALAKTIRKDNRTWGVPASGLDDETKLAHANSSMTCYTCHLSWTPSCFGCHLKSCLTV